MEEKETMITVKRIIHYIDKTFIFLFSFICTEEHVIIPVTIALLMQKIDRPHKIISELNRPLHS